MKKLFGIFILFVMCIIFTVSAIDYPQFKSAVSTTGIAVNFDTLYLKADQLNMVHDVVEHDAQHIVWKYKDTGNWAIVKEDGTVVVASPSAFSLDIKKVLNTDLGRVKDLVRTAGGSTSGAPLIYYVDDPYLYRVITYDFNSNFDLKLSVPNCTLQKAVLSILGSDRAWGMCDNSLNPPGQHYYINGKEVSGCDLITPRCQAEQPSGISCGNVNANAGDYPNVWVTVNPVDITKQLIPGIHTITSSGIDNQHTMIIEVVTSPTREGMLLYSNDYKTTINETRSLPMTGLYTLIKPNTGASNTNATK